MDSWSKRETVTHNLVKAPKSILKPSRESGAHGMPGVNALFPAMAEVILEHENASAVSAWESQPKSCPAEKTRVLDGASGQIGQIAQKTATEDLLKENACVQEKVAAKEQM